MLAEALSYARAAGLDAKESELQLAAAEVPVVIAFQPAAGQLDVLAGVIGSGWERLDRALGSARDHGLLYDESLCLLAAAAAVDAVGCAAPLRPEMIEQARAEHVALVERLGVVRR